MPGEEEAVYIRWAVEGHMLERDMNRKGNVWLVCRQRYRLKMYLPLQKDEIAGTRQ